MKETVQAGVGMKGFVTGRWLDLRTGESRPAFARRNQLTYAAADTMAQLMAGNTDFAPRFIGFIYGNNASVPGSLVEPSQRAQTWTGLGEELADVHGNIQIAPLSLTPSIAVDGAAGLYSGNSAILTAHTSASATYGFPLASPYAGELATGDFLYHVMLLTRRAVAGGFRYTPVARATLAEPGPVFQTKPDGFELAVDWQISFF